MRKILIFNTVFNLDEVGLICRLNRHICNRCRFIYMDLKNYKEVEYNYMFYSIIWLNANKRNKPYSMKFERLI